MAVELKMPALSPTMEKATLARWLVSEGDVVKTGDLLAEIETDKATMELEAVDEGRIASLLIPEGSADIAVGTVIGLIAQSGEAAAAAMRGAAASGGARPVETAPATPASPLPDPTEVRSTSKAAAPRRRLSPAERVKVSPLALRIAQAKGIDLTAISGTGPNGRIVRTDLGVGPSAARPPAGTVPVVREQPAPVILPAPPDIPVETVKLSAMRKTIARRLTESKQTIPHFYLAVRCNLDPLLKLRVELNDALAARGIKLSVNDMLIRALALALVEVPEANVQFGGDELHRFRRVDVSMAVAIDGGLVTPVIRGADTLSLSAIATRSKALAAKARDGKLLPEDYQGGTVSISNLGMFGIDAMVPVINPPQALIVGVGTGIEQPWKVEGQVGLATIMSATASFDHRAIDGAIGATFMRAFRALVEEPVRMLA